MCVCVCVVGVVMCVDTSRERHSCRDLFCLSPAAFDLTCPNRMSDVRQYEGKHMFAKLLEGLNSC